MTSRQADRVRALRGAITVAEDSPEAILEGTEELLRALIDRNGIEPDDLISIVFTATPDLRTEFPAAAARRLGIDVPLMCATEIAKPGALPRCIRVLAHLYGGAEELEPVYLRGAKSLLDG